MLGLLFTVTDASAQRQNQGGNLSHGISSLGALPKDVDEVTTDRNQTSLLLMGEWARAKGPWVFVDRNDRLVFAEEEPSPYAFAVGEIVAEFVVMGLGIWRG